MPISSSPDKDQIKVVIDEVTRWLDLAAEGDWMTLPGIAGKQKAAPLPGSVGGDHCPLPGGGGILSSSCGSWALAQQTCGPCG